MSLRLYTIAGLCLTLSSADKLDDVLTSSTGIFPSDSEKCPGAGSATFFSSVFSTTDDISEWRDFQLQYEEAAFEIEMTHIDARPERDWILRLGNGGQIMSLIVNAGESIANQASASAIWNDLVQQMIAVDGSKNYAIVNGTAYANFIHGSGVYAYDSEG